MEYGENKQNWVIGGLYMNSEVSSKRLFLDIRENLQWEINDIFFGSFLFSGGKKVQE